MDQMNNIKPKPEEVVDAAMRRDILISQIVDNEGDGNAWKAFTAIAANDPTAWRELAETQRVHAALAREVEKRIDVAEGVELPSSAGTSHSVVIRPAGRFSGWAVAALIALAWVSTKFSMVERTDHLGDRQGAGVVLGPDMYKIDSPQDAISAYKEIGMRKGTVLGEIPDRVVLQSTPLATGKGFEVVYIRQFMERAEVPVVYQVARDEGGQRGGLLPVAAPVRPSKQAN